MQQTLILLKPDAVQRRLVGEITAPVRAEGPAARRAEARAGRPGSWPRSTTRSTRASRSTRAC